MNYEKNLNKQSGICPKCAEKDAEIARLKKAIPGSDEFEEKIQIVATERDELKAKLEMARKALIKIYTDNSYSRDWHICAAINSTIEEALKQIGE